MRGSRQLQAPDCGAPAPPSDFSGRIDSPIPSGRGWISRGLLAFVGFLLVAPAHAGDRSRDLGPIPTDGVNALASLPDRQKRVIRELACGMEAKFMSEARSLREKRPMEILNGKAAVMAGLLDPQSLQCESTQILDPAEWDSSIDYIIDKNAQTTRPPLGPPVVIADASWSALKDAITQLNNDLNAGPEPAATRATDNAEEVKRLLNKLEFDTYGPACDSTVSKVDPVVIKIEGQKTFVEYRVTYSLSPLCLERQINSVILSRDFVRVGNPGSGHLPCHLFGSPPEGDWDMSVALLTRLTFLLRKAGTLRTLTGESGDAMDKMQTRLLTLSGGPAQEVHPIWHCGNPDNQYGSARDRLDDNNFYDPDLGKDVDGDDEGSNTGDDFLDFLSFLLLLLILLAIGLALAAIAALLAAIFGPILGAIILAILIALAAVADIPQLIAGALFGGAEETENHLFMQNSSKYLKNKMLIEESAAIGDTDAVKDYEEFNEDIQKWFMERMQRVAVNDFAEFNAKPYGRLSFTALLNVHDFACSAGVPLCTADDAHMVTGVAAIGDLTSAKMALGSNQGRRVVPFRRLSHTNTDYTIGKLQKDHSKRDHVRGLFDLDSGADHQIAAMQLWSGQTFHGPDGHASEPSFEEMSWEATSNYLPHRIVLDLAVNKANGWEQTFHHAGWERYSSGPAWLITAGGTESGYAQGFRTPFGVVYPSSFIKWGDRGCGVPTTLMVSSGQRLSCESTGCLGLPPARLEQPLRQDKFADFIRFEGKVVRWKMDDEDEPFSFNDNFGVTGSFACGINMKIPDFLRECMVSNASPSIPSGRQFSIIDSSTCKSWDDGDASNDIFVVVYEQPCKGDSDCGTGSKWGFIEVVTRDQAPTIKDLQDQIFAGGNAANFDMMATKFGKGVFTYESLTNGVIKFDPHGSWVTEVSGVAQPHGTKPDWPRAKGDVINRTGDGKYTIENPRTNEKMEIDFSNQKDPKRVLP